jgi:hypothetical protein
MVVSGYLSYLRLEWIGIEPQMAQMTQMEETVAIHQVDRDTRLMPSLLYLKLRSRAVLSPVMFR